jgi:hypothetical protein
MALMGPEGLASVLCVVREWSFYGLDDPASRFRASHAFGMTALYAASGAAESLCGVSTRSGCNR